MSSTRWSADTRRHKHENAKSHQHTTLQNTVHKSHNTRAHTYWVYSILTVCFKPISRFHGTIPPALATSIHINTATAPLPLTRCAVLRHKHEPSSVAITTFYSRAWVLRKRWIIVALLIPFFAKSFAKKERNHKTASTDFEFFKQLMFLLWLRTVSYVSLWLIRTGSKTKWQTSDRRTRSTGC